MTNKELEEAIRKEVERTWQEILDEAWKRLFEKGFGTVTYTTGDTAMVCPFCRADTRGQPHACGGTL